MSYPLIGIKRNRMGIGGSILNVEEGAFEGGEYRRQSDNPSLQSADCIPFKGHFFALTP